MDTEASTAQRGAISHRPNRMRNHVSNGRWGVGSGSSNSGFKIQLHASPPRAPLFSVQDEVHLAHAKLVAENDEPSNGGICNRDMEDERVG
jgi:hypothetical protein